MSKSLFASVFFLLASVSTAAAQTPAGDWDLTLNAGGTDRALALTLSESDGTFQGTLTETGKPGYALQDVRFDADTLRFAFDTPDYGRFSAWLAVEAQAASGVVSGSYGDFPTKGKRRADANAAGQVSGTWEIRGDVMGHPVNQFCTFDQKGAALTGRCTGADGTPFEISGEVKNEKITFQHGGEYQGEALTVVYTGTLASNQLRGDIDVRPLGMGGVFTATPVGGKR